MTVFAWMFTAMLAAMLLERLVLWRSGAAVSPWSDWVSNLNSGHLMVWLMRGVELALYAGVMAQASTGWLGEWPVWAQYAFGFVAWDFCFYWMHRMHHRWSWLWRVHSVHHQGEHFNLSLGVRNSWYSSLSNFPFIAVLAVLGLPLTVFVVVSSIHYSVQFYNHNALVRRSGWLDRWLVTPSNHRVHHGMHPAYLNKNFGGTLLLWDKLFGTYQAQRDDWPMQYGIQGAQPSLNPASFNHGLSLKASAHTCVVSESYIGLGGVLLFIAVIALVAQPLDSILNASSPYWVCSGSIVACTAALGMVSERRRTGLWVWMLASVGAAVALYQFAPSSATGLIGLSLILHALLGLRSPKRLINESV
jgi:sterol desaturase/sphingolipid hydroxylase (fatty acid hydroxylase superfamily)